MHHIASRFDSDQTDGAEGAGVSDWYSRITQPPHGHLEGAPTSSSGHPAAGARAVPSHGQGGVRGGTLWIAGAGDLCGCGGQIGDSYGGAISGFSKRAIAVEWASPACGACLGPRVFMGLAATPYVGSLAR